MAIAAEKAKTCDDQFDRMSCAPNPCNPSTAITLYSPSMSIDSKVNIFNGAGQLVKSFDLSAGTRNYEQKLNWDGTNSIGKNVPSGIYIIKWEKGNKTLSQKLVLSR